jgi:hypothetical protein
MDTNRMVINLLGVIMDGKARVYRFDSFGRKMQVIKETFEGMELAIVGRKDGYMVAFYSRLPDGKVLDLEPSGKDGILVDREGSQWDLFGNAICGPREGQKLLSPVAFMGYWFSFAAFYPEPSIYE